MGLRDVADRRRHRPSCLSADHRVGHRTSSRCAIRFARDAKLWPGGGRGWDWNETGTRHRPGIQPADLAELLDHDPDVVVFSRGRQLRLETTSEALALAAGRNVEVIRAETGAAIGEYNRLAAAGRRVAALLHSTC
ncbi:MAG: Mth938-like domain-containing protein [Actinomycetota bacterium]